MWHRHLDGEEFGKAKRDWFETFLELFFCIPSHDTNAAGLRHLDPEQFQACFSSSVQTIHTFLPVKPIAILVKTACGSRDREAGKSDIYKVCAWATQMQLVLAQRHIKEYFQ